MMMQQLLLLRPPPLRPPPLPLLLLLLACCCWPAYACHRACHQPFEVPNTPISPPCVPSQKSQCFPPPAPLQTQSMHMHACLLAQCCTLHRKFTK